MAVDTRDKRASALDVGSPWRARWPTADSTIAAVDRQFAAFMYSGIAAGAAAILVYGAAHSVASKVYHPGSQASGVYHPGSQASKVVEA